MKDKNKIMKQWNLRSKKRILLQKNKRPARITVNKLELQKKGSQHNNTKQWIIQQRIKIYH